VIVLAPGWPAWAVAGHPAWLTEAVIVITAGCGLAALTLLLAWLRPGGLRCLLAVAAGLVLLVAVHRVIAAQLFVARPFAADHFRPLFPHSADTSFPSDTTGYFAVPVIPAWRAWRWLGRAFAVMTVLVAGGCVYVGVHYVTDVAAGAAIGLALGGAAWALLGRPPAASLTGRADALLRRWRLRPARSAEGGELVS
jgi:undecaprenyl-diphosphatase